MRLSNESFPVDLRVHTLLDGTPVLTRWLDVTNTSQQPLALTTCIPWCGRLWSGESPVTLGHSLRWDSQWEGWFGWTLLRAGTNVFRNERGLVWDDPYFVLGNESNGEYFFGQLAWPVNYVMEFQRDRGLSFKIGPLAANALRVISPGETIRTPAVHLAHTKGDFDLTVQAMHDHIRRSASLHAGRIALNWSNTSSRRTRCSPSTVAMTATKQISKKSWMCALPRESNCSFWTVPTWAEGYGNWVPKAKQFPHGLAPLCEYAHQRGMLFGVYAEVEGGRGDWTGTKAFRQHPDWFTSFNGSLNASRSKCFLNLSIPAAAGYMESELTGLIQRLKLDIYSGSAPGVIDWSAVGNVMERSSLKYEEAYSARTTAVNALLSNPTNAATRHRLMATLPCVEPSVVNISARLQYVKGFLARPASPARQKIPARSVILRAARNLGGSAGAR